MDAQEISEGLKRIVALTLCVETFEPAMLCALESNVASFSQLSSSTKCAKEFETFFACRDTKVNEVIPWCLQASGCIEFREYYFTCMANQGADAGSEKVFQRAHQNCMPHYEALMKCGIYSVLDELKP